MTSSDVGFLARPAHPAPHLALEMIYELAYNQLCRKNTHQRHIVLHADGLPRLKFLYQLCHCRSAEYPVPLKRRRGKHVLHIIERASVKEALAVRRAVRLFRSPENRIRYKTLDRPL